MLFYFIIQKLKNKMGWFFNKKKDENDNLHKQQNQNQQNSYVSSSSYYSKKKSCKTDPEDPEYIICKTVIKDNNGTRQQQERMPRNERKGAFSSSQSSQFSSSSNLGQNLNHDEYDKSFENFPYIFHQPNLFNFHGMIPSMNHLHKDDPQVKRSFYHNTLSKTCRQDPQDPEYLICKSTIYDGKEKKQTQQRVQANQVLRNINLPQFGNQFQDIGSHIDQQMGHFLSDINTGFNFMMPFIGPMMGFVNAMNDPQQFQRNINNQQGNQFSHYGNSGYIHPNQNRMNNQNLFFQAPTQKDTNVYDL